MCQNKSFQTFIINSSTIKVMTLILSLAAAYFLTIQSIKMDLAGKAESQSVEIIDKKLTNIEVILKEGVLGKEQFYLFSKDVERRLSRIESLLENKRGAKIEKN